MRLWYREEEWDDGRFAPYQVRCCSEDGDDVCCSFVWVPHDTNSYIVSATVDTSSSSDSDDDDDDDNIGLYESDDNN